MRISDWSSDVCSSDLAGSKSAKAQKNAANQQAQQAADQIAEERRQYDTTRADYAPYRETGYKALDTLSSLYGVNPNGRTIDPTAALERSEERRVGKECVSTCRSRWSPYH